MEPDRERPWHDKAWLQRMIDEGKTYKQMSEIAQCNLRTIYDSMKAAGLITYRRHKKSKVRLARCAPKCPMWETCLDDVDAPCMMMEQS